MSRRTPEGRVKKKVKAHLDAIGAYYFMPVQTGYGKSTLDFLCCWRGLFFAIETKRGGKDLTPRQKDVRDRIEAARGRVYRINQNNVESLSRLLS